MWHINFLFIRFMEIEMRIRSQATIEKDNARKKLRYKDKTYSSSSDLKNAFAQIKRHSMKQPVTLPKLKFLENN
jgi:hypothetical protein